MTRLKDLKKFKRIAIMGGTFDPIHYGHLVAAETARHEFLIDYVLFVPTGQPYHKPNSASQSEHRYQMTVAATLNNPFFGVSRVEIDRSGKTYTIDTIRYLREILGEEKELFFITGADAVNEILSWKDSDILLTLCNFIAVTRAGYNKEKLIEQIAEINADYKGKIHFLEIPAIDISSRELRAKVSVEKPIKYLVPSEVEKYIEKTGLYSSKYDFEEINKRIKGMLSEKRYKHTIGVVEEAVKLAELYGENKEKARAAAFLHDCAKNYSFDELKEIYKKYGAFYDGIMIKQPELLHSAAGAAIAAVEFGVTDEDVLNAIRYHTTGRAEMSRLEKIIYLADFIEPNRNDFAGLDEVRAKAYNNLDGALIDAIRSSISHVKQGKFEIHPQSILALKHLEENIDQDQ